MSELRSASIGLPSRRVFLQASAVSVLALAASGVGLAFQRPRLRQLPAARLRVLSAEQYALLWAIADSICPDLGTGAPGASALDVAQKIDSELSHLDPEIVGGVKTALDLLENPLLGALLGEHLRPFTRLDAGAQQRVLDAWRSSRFAMRRAAYRAVRSMVAAVYFAEERTWQRIGYPGPPAPAVLRLGYRENLVDLDALRATPISVGAIAQ